MGVVRIGTSKVGSATERRLTLHSTLASLTLGGMIRDGEVHLWSVSLEGSEESLAYYRSLLSAEESVRAAKYLRPRDRAHFILCRGILRELLGRYLSVPGGSIEICKASRGKPVLAAGTQKSDLRFNLSHSHGFAVFAFTVGRDVGVDAELIREDIEVEEIARRYFSEAERAELNGLEGASRATGFFLCWTRKEAYLKARGEGLEIPLDSFSVTLTPDAPARLSSEDAERWSLHSLEIAEGWAAALVVDRSPVRILIREYLPNSVRLVAPFANLPREDPSKGESSPPQNTLPPAAKES
jgi:4'-phosphopantetheinyl transferase